jgi:hypothetical protein
VAVPAVVAVVVAAAAAAVVEIMVVAIVAVAVAAAAVVAVAAVVVVVVVVPVAVNGVGGREGGATEPTDKLVGRVLCLALSLERFNVCHSLWALCWLLRLLALSPVPVTAVLVSAPTTASLSVEASLVTAGR